MALFLSGLHVLPSASSPSAPTTPTVPTTEQSQSITIRHPAVAVLGSASNAERGTRGDADSELSENTVMSAVRLLEYPTLKVPYEVLNKKYRNAQKALDKESVAIAKECERVNSALRKNPQADATAMLDSVVERLRTLKRKCEEVSRDELESIRTCEQRIVHLKSYEGLPPAGRAIWKKQRLERMMVDFLLRNGCYESALQLAKRADVESLLNLDLFITMRDVEQTLLRHDTSKCLAWCHENRSRLRKIKSQLEFEVRTQDFVELVRARRCADAIKYAREYLCAKDSPKDDEPGITPEQLQRIMLLVALRSDTQLAPYKELFAEARWERLAKQFRDECCRLYQLPAYPQLHAVLEAGLSALKTSQCYHPASSSRRPSSNCPVCTKQLGELARGLPFSHCSQSRLICFISGALMNEHNPPLMLPNGYVYSRNALSSMAAANGGKVTCPRTGLTFPYEEAVKVYVM